MTEHLKKIKDQFVDLMELDIKNRGVENVNIEFHGKVADIVKDLSEAIYYCEVAKAMNSDNTQRDGYGGTMRSDNMRSGYGGTMTGGNGVMGYSDPLSTMRSIMMTADDNTKARIRQELGMM